MVHSSRGRRFSVAYRPSDFAAVIEAFATGTIDASRLVGPTIGLERLADAFDVVRHTSVEGRVPVTPRASS